MKKFFLTAMGLWIIGSVYAQVGVNTETPATTFHVLPRKTDSSTAEGIIAPNLKRSEVIAKDSKYATAQTGAMVYVSDLSGVLTTKTAKIITTGYYYFDGALWQPFTSGSASVTTANNGLTMNGTTTQLGGALIKATSITGTDRLTLATPTTISGILQITSGSPGTGKVLTSDINGTATWATPGISTANNGITMNGIAAQLGGDLTQATSITGTNRLTLATPLQISSGTPGAGKVLTSDASGNATWVAPTVTTANNGLTMNGTTTQLGGALTAATSITGTSRLTLATPTTVSGDLQYSGHGAAKGMILSSDASGNATWQNQNMLSGSWFYVPSINLDMSSTTQKTVNIFTQCIQQLTAATTPVAASSGYIRPTLPITATAYDYMVIGSSGHITNVSISTSGVLTYTPTTTNPPPFAFVNIMVRVK